MRLPLLLLTLTLAATTAWAAEPTKPNIILIIADDYGFGDYGFMGHQVVRTPHLDRIAGQSLLYTRGYVMPVCSPSLTSLLTGKLPHQHGITGNDLAPPGTPAKGTGMGSKPRAPLAQRLLSNSLLLPKALSDSGYLTLQTGKLWNMTAAEAGFTSGMTNIDGRHGGPGLDIGRKTMQPVFDFMDAAQRQNKPFFIWYAPMMPHTPHTPPAKLLEKYRGKGPSEAVEKYYAMCEWFDQTVGELDDHLTKRNLAENTVILYLADNGWVASGKQERGKLSPYETGIRTPMFVRWPGRVQPRRDEETLASIIDFAPTILKLAGAKMPPDLPGIDLLDRTAMTARKSVIVESYLHDIVDLAEPRKSLVAHVVIEGRFKLITPGPVEPGPRFNIKIPSSPTLFDVVVDPLETNDIASRYPEVVARLQGLQRAAWSGR